MFRIFQSYVGLIADVYMLPPAGVYLWSDEREGKPHDLVNLSDGDLGLVLQSKHIESIPIKVCREMIRGRG